MVKLSRTLGVAITVIVVGTLLFGGIVYAAPDADWPLEVTIGLKDYKFATHSGSATEGNWIELLDSTGTSFPLPTISFEYSGISSGLHEGTTADVDIDVDSSFRNDDVIYPYETHQLYYDSGGGVTINYKFNGHTNFAGNNYQVKLVSIADPEAWEDAVDDLFEGDPSTLEGLLGAYASAGTLDASGDATGSFAGVAAGDYVMFVWTNSGTLMEIYSATFVTVLESDISATVPANVEEGQDLDVDITINGGLSTGLTYGVVMIHEGQYKADAEMTGGSSVPTTEITINGATFIDAVGGSWEVFGGGVAGLNKDYLVDFMGDAFSGAYYSTAFGSASLSVTTNGLAEGDYHVFGLTYDSSTTDLTVGKRLVGLTHGTTFVEEETLPFIVIPIIDDTPDPDEIAELDPEDAVEIIEDLEVEDAVELIEELDVDDAAEIVEELEVETAVEIVSEMNTTSASEVIEEVSEEVAAAIVEELEPETAVEIIEELETETVTEILETVTVEAAADIVEAAIEPDQLDTVTTVMNEVGAEEAADILLEVEPSQGAQVVTGMAEKDLNAAAVRVEEAVKKKIGETDPAKAEEIIQKIATTLDNMDVGALVDIFTEIANLPNTPSTVAEVLYVWEPEKVQEVISIWMDSGAYEELAAVFSYFTPEFTETTYPAMSADDRTTLYPYFNAATLGMLPQLGEFTATISLSEDTVELGDSVTVTAVISNIGDETDSTTVGFSVDGTEVDSEIVSLDSGASTTLTWTVSKTAEGTYTVEVLGDTESFTVEAPPTPAEFSLSALSVSPSVIEPDVDVTVTFTVENTGELSGDYEIEVKVDGDVVETKTGSLDGGDSQMLTSTVTSDEEGIHTVAVDGLDAQFSVETVEQPSSFPIVYVAVGLVVIVAAAYFYMQSQKE